MPSRMTDREREEQRAMMSLVILHAIIVGMGRVENVEDLPPPGGLQRAAVSVADGLIAELRKGVDHD